jgi:hypothetical protein
MKEWNVMTMMLRQAGRQAWDVCLAVRFKIGCFDLLVLGDWCISYGDGEASGWADVYTLVLGMLCFLTMVDAIPRGYVSANHRRNID